MKIDFTSEKNIEWYGRTQLVDGIKYFDWSASGFAFCLTGKKAEAVIVSDSDKWEDNNKSVLGIYIKELSSAKEYEGNSFWEAITDEPAKKITLTENENKITLFESSEEKTVLVKVIKLTEVHYSFAGLKELTVEGKLCSPVAIQNKEKALKIEFIGDSITCGYGIEGNLNIPFTTQTERADKAYAWLTAKLLGAEFNLISWSGIGIISHYIDPSVNIPDTALVMPSLWPYTDKPLSQRLGKESEVWNEEKFSPDLIVVYLGTNDASYVRNIEERRIIFVNAYRLFLEAIHRRSPNARILCCLGTMDQNLCASVKEAAALFTNDFKLAHVKAISLPLQEEADGLGSDYHPTPVTHKKTSVLLEHEIKAFLGE